MQIQIQETLNVSTPYRPTPTRQMLIMCRLRTLIQSYPIVGHFHTRWKGITPITTLLKEDFNTCRESKGQLHPCPVPLVRRVLPHLPWGVSAINLRTVQCPRHLYEVLIPDRGKYFIKLFEKAV